MNKQETLDKKTIYIQDCKSRISALEYIIDFYKILSLEDIIKHKNNINEQLKKLKNE